MNYYPRYPGDYLAKTLHLSMVEDGAYTRLLDWYYSNEQPVPHSRRYAVARAASSAERAAVDAVLAEFFTADADMHRHDRVDAEIAEAAPRIAAAKANGSKGGRKPRKNPPDNPAGNPLGSARDTHRPSSPTPTPFSEDEMDTHADVRVDVGDQSPTQAGLMCRAMRAAGIADTNPGHPDLGALIAAGAEESEFVGAAQAAVKRGKGFAYAIGTLLRQRTEAAEKAKGLHQGSMTPQTPWHETAGGIKEKGAELGLPYTSEDDCKPFPVYRNKVFMAAGHREAA